MANLDGDYIALGPFHDTPLHGADPIFSSAVVIRDGDEDQLYALLNTPLLNLPSSGERFDTAYLAAASLSNGTIAVVNPTEQGIRFDFWVPLPDTATTADAIASVNASGTVEWTRRYIR